MAHLDLARDDGAPSAQVAAGAALLVPAAPLLLVIGGGREHVSDPAAVALDREALAQPAANVLQITGETS